MQVIAHRGVSARAPENTMPAFELVLAHGIEAVEFDVRLTMDDRLIVMHDDDVSRTAGVEGRVSSMTLEQVRTLNAAAVAWPTLHAAVPTLEQVLELLAGKVRLHVEVKGAWTGERYIPAGPVVDAAAPLLRGIPDVIVSSFEPDAVSRAKEILPGVPTGLASLDVVEPSWALQTSLERGFDECHVPRALVSASLVEQIHAAGKKVCVWTVNDPVDAALMESMGCDGVFSDDPVAIRQAMTERALGTDSNEKEDPSPA